MKWFISMPMKGKSSDEIKAKREKITEHILEKDPDAEIINSFHEDYEPCDGNRAMKFLARSIDKLAEADVAYFTADWQSARGCRIENAIASAYDITIVEDYRREGK